MRMVDGVRFNRRWTAVVLTLGAVLLLTGVEAQNGVPGGVVAAGAETRVPAAKVTITPKTGAKEARPDKGVVVKAAGGNLRSVVVKAKGKDVPGEFNAQRTEWRSKWTLKPSTAYTVNALAQNSIGTATQASSSFKTLKPEETIGVSLDWILEGNRGKKFGVGTPIILNFDREVRNREEVERALEVTAEKPIEGAWRWINNQQVIYRTKDYWPAHQTVKLNARLAGVRAAKDVYGTRDFTRTFEIGAARISKIDLKKHRMVVSIDGKKKRTHPVSGGNGTTMEYTTTSGVHLTMERNNPTRMVSPGRKKGDPGYYDELIGWAVRISNSGEYLHQTAGEEYCLGRANCSHGCVRQGSSDAIWFYKTALVGDVVDIKGTKRKLEWNNGWSFWQMSWKQWRKGSALS